MDKNTPTELPSRRKRRLYGHFRLWHPSKSHHPVGRGEANNLPASLRQQEGRIGLWHPSKSHTLQIVPLLSLQILVSPFVLLSSFVFYPSNLSHIRPLKLIQRGGFLFGRALAMSCLSSGVFSIPWQCSQNIVPGL